MIIEKITESVRGWIIYLTSLTFGSIGLLETLHAWLNLLFIFLGCVGLVLSISLSIKKLKQFNDNQIKKK